MRKIVAMLVLVCTVFVVPLGAAQSADSFDVEFGPAFPCFTLCPYWVTTASLGFSVCENPAPPASYADVVTFPAPTSPQDADVYLVVETNSHVDWDLWICGLLANGSHNGPELAQGANIAGQLCSWSPSIPPNPTGIHGSISFGCRETARLKADAGRRYVVRAYNWIDVPYLAGRYSWEFVAR